MDSEHVLRGSRGWPWHVPPILNEGGWPRNKPLPRISIITPSYNQGVYIEETIRSILFQGYPNLEYIVIDGGSRDSSVDIIKKYANQISYWESEKDRGQSHAINKGIDRCTGEIFNWINSDDLLMPGALWAVARAYSETPAAIVAGRTEVFDQNGTIQVVNASGQTLKNFVRFWEAENFEWTQQGTFIPLKSIREIGGLREDLHYSMDYVMMAQLLAKGIKVSCLKETLSRFRAHPESKTLGKNKDFRLEKVDALRALRDLPIEVQAAEWDAEQSRRLVDIARHTSRAGKHIRAAAVLSRAIYTSPQAALSELWQRARKKSRPQTIAAGSTGN